MITMTTDTTTTTPALTIGELAQQTGLSRRALRLYEDAGLLRPARGPNNYRRYSAADVQQARVIHDLRQGGLSLEAIAALFALKRSDLPPEARAEAAREVLLTMQDDLRARRAQIDRALDYVAAQVAALDQFLDEGDSDP
jgi:DNA-binding transcriptional MerR regulator